MKISVPLWIAASLLTPLAASAQSASTPAKIDDEVVVLSAFEVKSSKDTGYRLEKSVSTTGISQDLAKTPLAITVISEQFLKDAELEGFMGALSYVSSIALDSHAPDGTNSVGFQPNLNRFRGQPFNGTYRNGLKIPYGFGTENVDRVEIAKGPMAVFVGGATLGGELNVVTKKPKFYRSEELFLRTASHNTFAANLDTTGPVSKTVAYRLIGDFRDGNSWRDYSHSHTEFLNPQLLWRPTKRLSTSIDFFWRDERGNHVSQNVSSTKNYQADFDHPAQALLDLGKRRTTGASAGLPYTLDEYRARIGRAFGTWRQDVFDVSGTWVSLGTKNEGLQEGNAPDGRRYNYYGPNSPYKTNVRAIESETILIANDWFQMRVQGRYLRSWQEDDFVWFGARIYADGSTPIAGYGGQRWLLTDRTGKLESVFTKKLGWFDNKVLAGVQGTSTDQRFSFANLDYTAAGSVPASPNVFFSPATLTGANIYN
jgi:outer membrane receptor protein involved in Fe transport